MATIEIKDANGKEGRHGRACLPPCSASSRTYPSCTWPCAPSAPSWRQGTHNTLTRGQVSGGGKKPWRQKGTGRARQGTIRAPQWAGGGVVFGPHPRSYDIRVNKKEVKLAMRSALSAKLADGELHVVSDFGFDKPCTKDAVAVLKALGLEDRRLTIVVADDDVNAYLSFRNIPKVNVIPATEINTYELDRQQGSGRHSGRRSQHIEEVLA